ncbi:ComF family protein [Paenibacillus sp. Marseille-P2973]|uniref:ComF family protein n=1 Tax=Paenibacillus sp. Marseille-P2973 TaxID=1871032 RepID=UPI001B377EE2|nr:phosphoribosyltransferase family protein [Paenibacillus sp. Marseille-P2973]MBQ4899375.1 ComF family protein [Paenibacillus sp. Marseille-P2973]
MFIETNELKGILIYINKQNFMADHDWKRLCELIPCVFIVDTPERKVELKSKVADGTKFILNHSPLFGLPQTIQEAVDLLGIELFELAYITNDMTFLPQLHSEPIGSILLSQGRRLPYHYHGFTPDFILCSLDELIDVITQKYKGYLAEVYLTKDGSYHHGYQGYVFQTSLKDSTLPYSVTICGRYFDPSHYKFNSHQLSHRIKRSKLDGTQNALFSEVLIPVIDSFNADGITRVPPRPSKVSADRLKTLIQENILRSRPTLNDYLDALICTREYREQKQLGSDARFANVKDAFYSSNLVSGKHIILLDDVFTTGATVTECAETLRKAGATKVSILAIASHQFTPKSFVFSRSTLSCPVDRCDGHLRLTLKRNNDFFYGCSNFSKNNCKGGTNYFEGWHSINKQNMIGNYYSDFDDFDDLDF